jgi:nucleotide-binding universal stress UspA family protein
VTGRIVVGVDGSAGSVEALRWAVDEARRRGDTVEAVAVWHYPVLAADALSGTAMPVDVETLARIARDGLEEALARAVPGEAERAAVTRTVVEGSPGHVLVEAAEGAVLLVVGSRGLGGFAGLLLGSVSNHCVHHAGCPVTVVRPGSGR